MAENGSSPWWKTLLTLLMSGPDNSTPAIGRVLAAMLSLNCFAILPAFMLGIAVSQKVKFGDLVSMLPQITIFIGGTVASVVALIRVTNPTEPKP